MFFQFRQNNSGGHFDFNEERGLSVNVIIEADSIEEANRLAEDKGVYFDGCAKGDDCSCCGDRWYPLQSYDKGTEQPQVYDKVIVDNQTYEKTGILDMKWLKSAEAFIHYKDGRVVPSLI